MPLELTWKAHKLICLFSYLFWNNCYIIFYVFAKQAVVEGEEQAFTSFFYNECSFAFYQVVININLITLLIYSSLKSLQRLGRQTCFRKSLRECTLLPVSHSIDGLRILSRSMSTATDTVVPECPCSDFALPGHCGSQVTCRGWKEREEGYNTSGQSPRLSLIYMT